MTAMADLEKELTALGFSRHNYPREEFHGQKVLFQRRIEGVEPVCACNDKLHLNVTLYSINLHGREHESVEVDITGETPDGVWAALKLYSLKPEEVLGRVAHHEKRLIACWKAACA